MSVTNTAGFVHYLALLDLRLVPAPSRFQRVGNLAHHRPRRVDGERQQVAIAGVAPGGLRGLHEQDRGAP